MHSIKSRLKDPKHLKDKLYRKLADCKNKDAKFSYTPDNLFKKVTDLAGVRILHLHTRQMKEIDKCLKRIFEEQSLLLKEGPSARTWDDESREFFKSIGIETVNSQTMYTSVHYIIASNNRNSITCEIQVRTLMEEVWGEVDHSINYPHTIGDVSCKEQILVLARATSTATRLVDSIFATVDDIAVRQEKARKK